MAKSVIAPIIKPAVYIDKIDLQIKDLLEKAKSEIIVAVAWFNYEFLANILYNKQREGVVVNVLISNHEINYWNRSFFDQISTADNNIKVLDGKNFGLMHHKFCIVDKLFGFTGSYNWTVAAETRNREHIVTFISNAIIEPLHKEFYEMFKIAIPYKESQHFAFETSSVNIADEKRLSELQEEFEKQVRINISAAEKSRIKFEKPALLNKIKLYGAVGTARMLTAAGNGEHLQGGFKAAAQKDKLELTFEALVLDERFRELFSEAIRKMAEKKMEIGRALINLPPEPKR